jgi:hypothetical protein
LTASGTIKQLLQQQWSLTNPAASDIDWTDTKFDAAGFPGAGKSFVIACYSPTGPVQTEPLSREAWKKTEQVIVDIMVKITGSPEDACNTRESMRGEVYRIIHASEFTVPGFVDVYPVREPYKVESGEWARLAIQFACVSFDIRS